MPNRNRTFRVFVSSTFGDFAAERDALHRRVFPALRTRCEAHGFRFQAIDLRWGVRDEAALDHRTMTICLREIRRCRDSGIRPHFMVLLGDRYGWRPLPARIDGPEFESLMSALSDEERDLATWSEASTASAEGWYRRDDNCASTEYVLRRRLLEAVALADEKKAQQARASEAAAWNVTEGRLRALFLRATDGLGWVPGDPRRTKFEASATHQEILEGLGRTDDDATRVMAFVRTIHARLPGGGKAPLSEHPDRRRFDGFADVDDDAAGRLNALRRELRRKLPLGVNRFEYTATWRHGHPSAGHIDQLCADAQQCLEQAVDGELSSFKSRSALSLETEAHDTFAASRECVFGRTREIGALRRYLMSSDPVPFVLYGASGSGKSSIMAKASAAASEAGRGDVVIRRFLGTTPESSAGMPLLGGLCQHLSDKLGGPTVAPPDYETLAGAFQARLALATAERPVVIFLDALDQLPEGDPAASLTWLPVRLPAHVRLVVSTIKPPRRFAGGMGIEVEDFRSGDAERALDAWLDDAGRRLDARQRRIVLTSFARCPLPLYLKLAFEEARHWRSFDADGKCHLGEEVAGVIDTLLSRLSAEENHGPLLVEHALGYLAAGRDGLAEQEMLDVLTRNDQVWTDFLRRAHHEPPERRLPVIVWSRLSLDLEPYLTEREVPGGPVTSFYHSQLAARISARYLQGAGRGQRHEELARYFGSQPTWLDSSRTRPNARKATEVVFQQTSCGSTDYVNTAAALVTDLEWVDAKCRLGLLYDLQRDYERVLDRLLATRDSLDRIHHAHEEIERWCQALKEYSSAWSARRASIARGETVSESQPALPAHGPMCTPVDAGRRQDAPRGETSARLERLRHFQEFVRAEAGPLLHFANREEFVTQHAFNAESSGAVHEAAAKVLGQRSVSYLRRRWPVGPSQRRQRALIRTLNAPDVCCLALTADGRRALSGTVARDGAIRVWDLDTGECLRTLDGHKGAVWSISVTPDGSRAVSGGEDGTLRVWDLESSACLNTLDPAPGAAWRQAVRSVCVMPDGLCAVAGSDDLLRVWNLADGTCSRVLGRSFRTCVSVTPDGRRAVSGSVDDALRVWDLDTGECLSVLPGHRSLVMSIGVTSDGSRAVSGSADCTLRLWDLETRTCLRVLEGHSEPVHAVCVTPDGQRAVSGSDDRTLRVWDLEAGTCLRVLHGHEHGVQSLGITPDGRRALSESLDKTIRLWDLEAVCPEIPVAHSAAVTGVSVSQDGCRAVSAGQDLALRVWDLDSMKCLRVLHEACGFSGVSVTADNRRVFATSEDRTMRVWELKTGACLRTFNGEAVFNLAVTRDERRAVTTSGGGEGPALYVWELDEARCVHVLPWDPESGLVAEVSVCITPDGRFAVSAGGADPRLRVWDLGTGECLKVLEGHDNAVWTVSVAPDGRRALSGSQDGTLRLWDLPTGVCLGLFEGHAGPVRSVHAMMDGRRAVSGSEDRTLRVWDLQTRTCLMVTATSAAVLACASSRVDSDGAARVVAGLASGEVVAFDLAGRREGSRRAAYNPLRLIESATRLATRR
jgi:NACHT domain- and WD repeat-containing protein